MIDKFDSGRTGIGRLQVGLDDEKHRFERSELVVRPEKRDHDQIYTNDNRKQRCNQEPRRNAKGSRRVGDARNERFQSTRQLTRDARPVRKANKEEENEQACEKLGPYQDVDGDVDWGIEIS